MKHILLFIMIFVGMNSYAQNEFNSKFKAIPPANTGIPPKKIAPKEVKPKLNVAPNVPEKADVSESSSDSKIGESKPISMMQSNDFINPGDKVKNNLNKDLDKTLLRHGLKEDDSYIRRTDVDFGVIRTKSQKLILKMRDAGEIDGDLIKVSLTKDYITGILTDNLYLREYFVDIPVYLKMGMSFLELEAISRGLYGGNTGYFEIYDEEGKLLLSNYWDNIDKGVKSKFTIIRE